MKRGFRILRIMVYGKYALLKVVSKRVAIYEIGKAIEWYLSKPTPKYSAKDYQWLIDKMQRDYIEAITKL